ncbi:kunitz trypsin inhibitor 5-like [Vicia villosa]|uniref:kunitz trypsin inhibitor 5-like n=1 Tax=Vicia villosa TaxID=3911 RepID=UPI00273ADAE2|nr:kunitz trypsin inhibitor 5-like [Vicia villosa]
MKSKMLAFLFFFALSTQPLLGSTQASTDEVLDTSGKKVRVDANYYIIPATPFFICGFVSCFNISGGVALETTGESCPLDVVLVKQSLGLPLRFKPVKNNLGVIGVSTDLNIMFSNETSDSRCPHDSLVWKIDPFPSEETFVTTGGVLGNPGSQTIGNWFRIEKYEDAYRLVYCPNVCLYCKHVCKDIGNYVNKTGEMHLALTDVPFKVKFQKV